ncbi:LPXTG cell wall anchor domain-containing protein [Streptomyces sp. NPDC101115]|uniref:LPXTG cell wall anchor domain-containing protein n=1 Tax=Streptomyces sp. NPDC101115 TaxID=3366106 RepID=UPI00380C2D8C
MKIRRILATAVAAAVTTPVMFLSAAPAFAEDKPATQTQDQKQTIKELREAVVKAQTAYEAAVVAHAKAEEALAALEKTDNPLNKAAADAKKASELALAEKNVADGKLADAEKALVEIQAKPDATADEKALAEKAVSDAKATAATAKTNAETKAKEAAAAKEALGDESVARAREAEKARVAKEKAAKELDAAKSALAEALAEEEEEPGEECEADKGLIGSLTGPKEITAGQSGVFTFRVTNKGNTEIESVDGSAEAYMYEHIGLDKFLHVSWSSTTDPKWQPIEEEDMFSTSALKPGKSFDFKLKVTVDAGAPAGDGAVSAGAGYVNEDGSCGWTEQGTYAGFAVVKPTKPGTGSTGGNGNTTQQGGSSTTPVTTGTTGGTLANTGAGSSTMPIALAGGAAVVLGAGAMVVVRRRKAGADA